MLELVCACNGPQGGSQMSHDRRSPLCSSTSTGSAPSAGLHKDLHSLAQTHTGMPRHIRKLLIYSGIFLRFTSKWILWASVHGEWVAERMASWHLILRWGGAGSAVPSALPLVLIIVFFFHRLLALETESRTSLSQAKRKPSGFLQLTPMCGQVYKTCILITACIA